MPLKISSSVRADIKKYWIAFPNKEKLTESFNFHSAEKNTAFNKTIEQNQN